MGKRTHLLLLVIASLLAGAFGSLIAVAATTDTAEACSVAGPHAEVWPSQDLRPGQEIEIVGWGFFDIRLREPQPEAVPPVDQNPDQDWALRPELCDFDMYPIEVIDIVWRGEITERLGVVTGPDF